MWAGGVPEGWVGQVECQCLLIYTNLLQKGLTVSAGLSNTVELLYTQPQLSCRAQTTTWACKAPILIKTKQGTMCAGLCVILPFDCLFPLNPRRPWHLFIFVSPLGHEALKACQGQAQTLTGWGRQQESKSVTGTRLSTSFYFHSSPGLVLKS